MGKKTMRFVRRRKWTRSHRLMGLSQEPSPLFASMKDRDGSSSKAKSRAGNQTSGNVNKTKKKGMKNMTINSSKPSFPAAHASIDHEVADADDEEDEDEDEDPDEDGNCEGDDDDIDEEDENIQYSGCPSNPDDPKSGVRLPGSGTEDSNPSLYRLQVS